MGPISRGGSPGALVIVGPGFAGSEEGGMVVPGRTAGGASAVPGQAGGFTPAVPVGAVVGKSGLGVGFAIAGATGEGSGDAGAFGFAGDATGEGKSNSGIALVDGGCDEGGDWTFSGEAGESVPGFGEADGSSVCD